MYIYKIMDIDILDTNLLLSLSTALWRHSLGSWWYWSTGRTWSTRYLPEKAYEEVTKREEAAGGDRQACSGCLFTVPAKYLSGVAVGAAVISTSVLFARVQLRVDSCRGMDFVGGAG